MCNYRTSGSLDIASKDIPYYFSFFLIDCNALILWVIVISQTPLKPDQFAALHFHFQAFFNISGNILNFLLCNRTQNDK